MRRNDRPRDAQAPDYPGARRPAPPLAHSLALAAAIPVATVVLLHPAGPVLLLALAVSAVLVAQWR